MPLTISIAQLSQAVELTVSGSPDPPDLAIVTRELAVAEAIIELYADGAPDDIKNEAAIRIVGYLLNAPFANPSRNVSAPEGAFRNSGAKPLLSGWHDAVPAGRHTMAVTGLCPPDSNGVAPLFLKAP